MGHDVTLFASGDSKTKAKLSSVFPVGLIDYGVPWSDTLANNYNLSQAFLEAEKFDIIHSHSGLWTAFFMQFAKHPAVINTLHNIPKGGDWRWQLFEKYKNIYNPIFISQKQKQNSPVKFKNDWLVYNGIDVLQYKFNPKPEDKFIWIARVAPEKGVLNALTVAKKTGVRLTLAGQVQDMQKQFFETKVKPHLNKKIEFIGELSQKQLSPFYGSGKALLYPIEWEEPFGLVLVEAMACGTPVIAFNKGSIPEIIEHGKTGFVVNNVDEMIEAMKNIDSIDRNECRRAVQERFSKEVMTAEYEKIYYQLLEKK